MMTTVWAHRGASSIAPENTMEAFELAAQQRADGIELDIHLTKDGHLVVIHDDLLDRTTNGKGLVESYTMSELKKYTASFNKENYAGAKIPDLIEVLDWMKSNDIQLNIEIKEELKCNQQVAAVIVQLEKKYLLAERIIYSSFSRSTLMNIKKMIPHARIGLLYHENLVNPWRFAKAMKVDYLHPSLGYRTFEQDVESGHKNGLSVNVWTVDEATDMEKIYYKKCYGLITNKPNLAIELRKKFYENSL